MADYTAVDIQLAGSGSDETVSAIRSLLPPDTSIADKRLSNSESQSSYYTGEVFIYGFLLIILRDEEGIGERDIYVERESGRQFERPVYRSLVDNLLREGDLLVVTELKRFGRNYSKNFTIYLAIRTFL